MLTFQRCLGRRTARCSFVRMSVEDEAEDDEEEEEASREEPERDEHVPVR